MTNTAEDSLIGLLDSKGQHTRMKSLHLLCESYASAEQIFEAVRRGWQAWGADKAFPEFPMLSYFPIPANHLAECIQLATSMSEGRSLTDKSTRCGGKIMEQLVRLPTAQLAPHLDAICQTTASSKIFFRVNTDQLARRIAMRDHTVSDLADQLDQSVAALTQDATNDALLQSGLDALEALRTLHPDSIDMATAVKHPPPDEGPPAISFRVSMLSIIELPQAGMEETLATHLIDAREGIYTLAVEALVRLGTATAAAHMIKALPEAAAHNRAWIARGLQRIRADGLAEELYHLRQRISDPRLWLMLLIAEIHQLDSVSLAHTPRDLDKIASDSEALLDAMAIFIQVHATTPGSEAMFSSFQAYLGRYQGRMHAEVKALKQVAE